MVLFNNSDEDADAPITLDLDALGISATGLRNFESGEVHSLTDGKVSVPIGARDFRLLFME